ncbi:MAG: hypothetical protein IPI49_33610 [Myxococcales bacterium]|nr:hypothetical protein [Myxococcales bacterium]
MSERSAPPDAVLCIRCGGPVTHDARGGGLRCASCGARSAPPPGPGAVPRHELFPALAQAARGGLRDVAPMAQTVACNQCGAVTATDHHATLCPFCGGALVTAEPSDGHLPDAVAPFSVDEDAAAALISRWLAGRWFAPSDLHRAAQRDRLQGVYLPYWSLSLRGTAEYTGERGDAHYRSEPRVGPYGRLSYHQIRHVRWRRKSGQVHAELRDHLVPASTSLPNATLEGLAPWPAGHLVPFAAEHLHGFLAERYRIDLSAAYALAKDQLGRELTSAARRDLGGDEQRVQRLTPSYQDGTFRLVLLPLWSTAFSYRGRIYRVAVNGQTGRLHGTRPWSRAKLGALAAARWPRGLLAVGASPRAAGADDRSGDRADAGRRARLLS